MYPLSLEAGRILANASGDAALAAACAADRDAAGLENDAALWVEAGAGSYSYWAYGAQLDGSGRADSIMFGGQAAGSMLARHAGWGDVGIPFAHVQSSLRAQLALQVAPSLSFYAPKVFNLTSKSRAIDPHNGNPSSTWPFYLESYTAIAAMQAGFVDDALELLRYIQLVNARLGLTWSQNLWNPGSITYVAAPVSFFVTDVLAGVALDVPAATLFVSPFVRANETAAVTYAVMLPQVWLSIRAQRSAVGAGMGLGGGSLTVAVTRFFADAAAGGAPPVITSVAASPLGTGGGDVRRAALGAPFELSEGAVLDLSQLFDTLVVPVLQDRVLPPQAP